MVGVMTEKEIYTVAEAAKRLGVSHDTVVRRIRQGKLKARQEGKVFRIHQRDLDDYIRRTEYRPEQEHSP